MPAVTDPLILPADVLLVPVADLPEQVRSQFDCEEDDVAITRPRSRTPSKVIDSEAAALLSEFRSAKTIVEAVLSYSLARKMDPRMVLESAFPVIQRFVNAQLLVPADATAAERIEVSLVPGDQVGTFTVVRSLQVLQDTELLQARDDEGHPVALKIARPHSGQMTAHMLRREAAILRHLDGHVAPRLVTADQLDERAYLALTWCEGVSADVAAAEIRGFPGPEARAALLALCISILEAYAELHHRGVVHGDVHPRNVLVDGAGDVKLVDFGLARLVERASEVGEPHRGGVAFFYEPEYAEAVRAGQQPPMVEALGEQYSLAALLYHLLTGAHYRDFSLEKESMLQQIAVERPLPFADHGVSPWPEVEQVLSRALSKEPGERFPDVAAFAASLKTALRSTAKRSAKSHVVAAGATLAPETDALLDDVLKRLGWPGPWVASGLNVSPTASVNYGAAGIAYMLYRVSGIRDDPSLLALADVWATSAAGEVEEESGFYNAEIEITPETVGRVSPYHTPSGVHAVRTLIAQAMGDVAGQQENLHAFVAAASQPCDELDLTLGRSGLLVVGALLVEALPDITMSDRSGLLDLGTSIGTSIWEELDQHPPIKEASDLSNLGIAHGWAGFLYAALRWSEATGRPAPATAEERLHQLAACGENVGRGMQWPWQLDGPQRSYMPGWCNGSAGYVFLWTLAHRQLGHPHYRRLAQKAAWNAWEDPAPVANLCCGLTGRAYALLHWYNHTDDISWLHRALVLANRAAVNVRAMPLDELEGYENSLYKGEVGVAALIADCSRPETAALPLFESEGWPSSASRPVPSSR